MLFTSRRLRHATVSAGAVAMLAVPMLATSSPAFAAGVKVVSNVTYWSNPGDKLDEYLPTTKANKAIPAMIFIHGGAWNGGDKAEWASYASNFVASTGWPAFNINYNTGSTALFATEPQDVAAAIDWVKAHAKTFNVDPSRIGLIGDSAGGHLAMLAGTTGSGPATGSGRVKLVVSWSGLSDLPLVTRDAGCFDTPCDYTSTTQWIGSVTQNFERGTLAPAMPDQWAATSPVALVDPTDAQMLLFNSSNEMVNIDQLNGMEAKLASNGVPVQTVTYDGTSHGMGYASKAWPATLTWVKTRL
jgi:acetyl esterase/lipase